MAAGKTLLGSFYNKLCFSQVIANTTIIPKRTAIYSPQYLAPTHTKEELAESLDEDDKRRFQPIKAATPEQTSISNYDQLVARFIRHITREGKKERAHNIINRTFEKIKCIQLEKYNKATSDLERDTIELNPLTIFHKAIENCRPLLILQKVKRGGVLYQVPIPVKPSYATFQSMKWLIESGGEKDDDVRIWDRFSFELIDAANNEGKSIRKKQELHRICEANRAYAHFRW